MKKPVIQNAIRLTDFTVSKVDMSAKRIPELPEENPIKINLGLKTIFDTDKKRQFITRFTIVVKDKIDSFVLQIIAEALFETKEEINEDFIESDFAAVNAPAIAFPFVRSFINTLTVNAGLKALILPAFNFTQMKKKDKPTEK